MIWSPVLARAVGLVLLVTLLFSREAVQQQQIQSGEVNVTVTSATQNGTALDPSEIKLVPKPLSPSLLSGLTRPPPDRENEATPFRGWATRKGARQANPVGYSGNWCGAGQHVPRPTDKLTAVVGVFTVPKLSLRPDTDTPQFVAAWIGMDGASCQSTLVQAGTTTEIRADGTQSSSAWFEWFPDAAFGIESLKVSPGDTIRVAVTTTSSSKVVIYVYNLNTLMAVEIQLSSATPLCRVDAEWIVENFGTNFGQVPFARFEDIWFQTCEAKVATGGSVDIGGATMIYLLNGGPEPNCYAGEWDNQTFYAYSS